MARGRPLDCTPRELAKFGVTVLDFQRLWLSCVGCGRSWIPRKNDGGRLPNGYWKCPNRCQEQASPRKTPIGPAEGEPVLTGDLGF